MGGPRQTRSKPLGRRYISERPPPPRIASQNGTAHTLTVWQNAQDPPRRVRPWLSMQPMELGSGGLSLIANRPSLKPSQQKRLTYTYVSVHSSNGRGDAARSLGVEGEEAEGP